MRLFWYCNERYNDNMLMRGTTEMRVMIVDDEWASVDVLKTEINWAEFGFQEVLCAFNSDQSKEQFRQTEIDLLVCDIEMPQGSGLELAEWVRSHSPSTLIVFLTCHDKFSFAQRALQLGSYDYLVKPIDFDVFNRILSKAANEIAHNQKQSWEWRELEKYRYLWDNKKFDLIEKFWQDLLDGRILQINKGIENVLQSLAPASYWPLEVLPVLISIERWHRTFEQADEEILEYAIRNAAVDLILDNRKGGVVFQDHSGINIMLIYCYSRERLEGEKLFQACEVFIQECGSLFYCDVSCYIGWQVPIAGLMNPYNALRFEEQNHLTASRQVIALQFDQNAEVSGNLQMPDFFEWAEWISNGNDKRLNMAIQEVTDRLRRTDTTTADVQRFKQDMVKGLLYSLRKKGSSESLVFEEILMALVKRSIASSKLKQWIDNVVQHAREYLQNMEREETVIDKVMRLIRSSLSEELNREDLAAAVHLNPGYLSRLFKKEAGCSLTDFITQERMKLASELLRTNATVTEIASATGYSYQSHFSKMFKKTFQMSPQEYRSIMRSSNGE